jgi:hypothetical protein
MSQDRNLSVGDIAYRPFTTSPEGGFMLIRNPVDVLVNKAEEPIGILFRIQNWEAGNGFLINPNVQFGGVIAQCYTSPTKLKDMDWIGMRVISRSPSGKSVTCVPVLGTPETDLYPRLSPIEQRRAAAAHVRFMVERSRTSSALRKVLIDALTEILGNAPDLKDILSEVIRDNPSIIDVLREEESAE